MAINNNEDEVVLNSEQEKRLMEMEKNLIPALIARAGIVGSEGKAEYECPHCGGKAWVYKKDNFMKADCENNCFHIIT